MSGKHTPGPWVHGGTSGGTAGVFGAEHPHEMIATTGFTGHEEAEANARLISAAPDMLEALRRLALVVEDIGAHGPGATRDEIIERMHRDDSGVLRSARAAIRKATGGEGGAR